MAKDVTVVVPTPFQEYTDGQGEVTVAGETVNDVLASLGEAYPGIEGDIRAEDGGLQEYVNLYRNDEDIRYLDALDTELDDGDELAIVPAIAGG
jgi:molybdopterin synthase sulfur carrier subunit